MNKKGKTTIFEKLPHELFYGRHDQLTRVRKALGTGSRPPTSLFIRAPRHNGKTELMARMHTEIFYETEPGVTPIFYRFDKTASAIALAQDVLKETVKQAIAHKKRDPSIATSALTLDNLNSLAAQIEPQACEYISRHVEGTKAQDLDAVISNAANYAAEGSSRAKSPFFFIFDDIDRICHIEAGAELIKRLTKGLNFVASHTTKDISAALDIAPIETIELGGIGSEAARRMIADRCRRDNIPFDSETVALAAKLLDENPAYINAVLRSVSRHNKGLSNIRDLADLYAQEIANGAISSMLRAAIPLSEIKDLKILISCADLGKGALRIEDLASKANLSDKDAESTVKTLAAYGIADIRHGVVTNSGNKVVNNYAGYIFDVSVKMKGNLEAEANLKAKCLKELYLLRGSELRPSLKNAARELLGSFNCQKAPEELFKCTRPGANEGKGALSARLPRQNKPLVSLPEIIGVYDAATPKMLSDNFEMIVGRGFDDSRYDEAHEVIWVIAIKDSCNHEASPMTKEEAGDVLSCFKYLADGYASTRHVNWVVANNGFTDDAIELLACESVYASDERALQILKNNINSKDENTQGEDQLYAAQNEFQMTLPNLPRAELAAAKAAREIALNMRFDEENASRISAAVIEACINAFEHGRLKSAVTSLRFVSHAEKLAIIIRNRGIELREMPSAPAEETKGLPKKRGWGMEIMKGLMDEVRLEKLKDGTEIVLVKYLTTNEGGRGDETRA